MILSSASLHFKEIRKRIIIWSAFWCFSSLLIYFFQDAILYHILSPLKTNLSPHSTIITTHVTEGFMVRLKLILGGGFLGSFPFALYQIWRFMIPGLYKHEKNFWGGMLFLSLILFFAGVIVAHMLILPFALAFLKSFSSETIGVALFPSLSAYLGFYVNLLIAFGMSFEFPIALLILGKMKLISSQMLQKNRRLTIVAIFIFAAIITPPDVFSQVALALPLVGFYEVVILVLKRIEKSHNNIT